MAAYSLPDLPYEYSALEPYISAETMRVHHLVHHREYVDRANLAIGLLAEARNKRNFSHIRKFHRDLACNLGHHINHSLFWLSVSPHGGGAPVGEVRSVLEDYFGSFSMFRDHFSAAALDVPDSGFITLAWDEVGRRPHMLQLLDQEENAPMGMTPLLSLDVADHAYQLDYPGARDAYVAAFWQIVDWVEVARRLDPLL